MRVLIVFNHPAPYKVKLFNELSKHIDLDVIFERRKALNRNKQFYNQKIQFNAMFCSGIKLGKENVISHKVKSYIKKHHNDYDTIIMNGYSTFAEMLALNYMIKNHIPYTLMVNGGVIKNDSKIKLKLKQKYISNANKYLAPNDESSRYLQHYGAKKEEISLFPYSNIMQKDILTMSEINKIKSNGCFVSVGQFIERKNNEQLIRIFKNRKEKLLLVGEGPLKKKYLNIIKTENITNVDIIGYLPENLLFALLKKSKALVSLSKEDIYGHTIIEALANGIPVIASNRILSALQIIKKEYNGFVVDINDDEEINDVLNKTDQIDKINCIESILKFTIEESAKTIIEKLK